MSAASASAAVCGVGCMCVTVQPVAPCWQDFFFPSNDKRMDAFKQQTCSKLSARTGKSEQLWACCRLPFSSTRGLTPLGRR